MKGQDPGMQMRSRKGDSTIFCRRTFRQQDHCDRWQDANQLIKEADHAGQVLLCPCGCPRRHRTYSELQVQCYLLELQNKNESKGEVVEV